MKTKGIIKYINPTKQATERFTTRSFGLDTSTEVNGTMYPAYMAMQVTQDNCAVLDAINIGDEVEVNWGVKGNLSKAKEPKPTEKNPLDNVIYVNLEATSITVINKAGGAPATSAAATTSSANTASNNAASGNNANAGSEDADGPLPF